MMPSGNFKGGYKVTGNVNVTGNNTVLKNDFDTSAVKIAERCLRCIKALQDACIARIVRRLQSQLVLKR